MLSDPIIQRAYETEKNDNPFELNEKNLEYAKNNLRNLLQSEDEFWRHNFAKHFAFRAQGLADIIDQPNEHLAEFFKQIAEKSRQLDVDPAQRLADAFATATKN